MKNRSRFIKSMASMLLVATTLSSCTQMAAVAPSEPTTNIDGTVNEQAAGFTQFPDLPFPPGSLLDIENTFIVGSNDGWYGQTSAVVKMGANSAFDFYKQQLPDFGWVELSSVRAQTSILTYTRDHRVLAIQLTPGNITTTDVMITVSPRDGTRTVAPTENGATNAVQ